MIFDMLEYRDLLNKHNVNIIYSGPIWADGIERLGDMVKNRLKFDDVPFSTSQSVFSVFVEQMNNMLMYSAEKEHVDLSEGQDLCASKGMFTLGLQDNTYFIQCGNIIKNESVGMLKSRIDYLNTLDKEGLRKFYKEQIKSESKNPESKGAGLGLIEIARRANSPIEYSFTPLEDGFTFYALFVTISQGEK